MDGPSWLQIIVTSAVTGALASGTFSLIGGALERRHSKGQRLFALRAQVYEETLTFFYNLPGLIAEVAERAIREKKNSKEAWDAFGATLSPVRARLAIHASRKVRDLAKATFAAVAESEKDEPFDFHDHYDKNVAPSISKLADAMATELHP